MSTLYIDTNPDLSEGFGAFDDDECRPLFSDAEIDAYERRRDAERVEFECKAQAHNKLLYRAEIAMAKLTKITL